MFKRFIKYLIAMFLLVPAIIFWALFAYAGSDLTGIMALLGFIVDGYRAAELPAREVFLNGIAMGSVIITVILSVVGLVISIANGENKHAN